jgi:hypothetical protein
MVVLGAVEIAAGVAVYSLIGLVLRKTAYNQVVDGELVNKRNGQKMENPERWATVFGIFWLPLLLWGGLILGWQGLGKLARLK